MVTHRRGAGGGSARNILVTGGSGFIGSNLTRLLFAERPDWRVVSLDKLAYAGTPRTSPTSRRTRDTGPMVVTRCSNQLQGGAVRNGRS